MHLGHGHGLVKAIGLGFCVVVGALYALTHPIQAVTLVWRVVGLGIQLLDNLATGRYQ